MAANADGGDKEEPEHLGDFLDRPGPLMRTLNRQALNEIARCIKIEEGFMPQLSGYAARKFAAEIQEKPLPATEGERLAEITRLIALEYSK